MESFNATDPELCALYAMLTSDATGRVFEVHQLTPHDICASVVEVVVDEQHLIVKRRSKAYKSCRETLNYGISTMLGLQIVVPCVARPMTRIQEPSLWHAYVQSLPHKDKDWITVEKVSARVGRATR